MTNQREDQAEWIEIGTFNTGLEADMACQTLDAQGILVLVKSNASGIFGAGFQGAIGGGVTVYVPSPEADRAQSLLAVQP